MEQLLKAVIDSEKHANHSSMLNGMLISLEEEKNLLEKEFDKQQRMYHNVDIQDLHK